MTSKMHLRVKMNLEYIENYTTKPNNIITKNQNDLF